MLDCDGDGDLDLARIRVTFAKYRGFDEGTAVLRSSVVIMGRTKVIVITVCLFVLPRKGYY